MNSLPRQSFGHSPVKSFVRENDEHRRFNSVANYAAAHRHARMGFIIRRCISSGHLGSCDPVGTKAG